MFPKNFLWGAASAAAQVEGAWDADGRTPSIWDVLSDGHIKHGETCHEACDHYHRFREDVALMKELGLKSYRFSVSWSRIVPAPGIVNEEGLRFYRELVEALCEAGIEPLCTLYHWDLPLWMYEKGGWENPEIAVFFADYTRIVAEALSDKVKWWMTLNEPQCFIGLGYEFGGMAPFLRESARLPRITRNACVSHGLAVKMLREHAKLPPKIGFAPTGPVMVPRSQMPDAIEEARKASYPDDCGSFSNNWWADPLILGKVPAPLKEAFSKEDLSIACQKLDFFAYNVYNSLNYHDDFAPNPNVRPGQPRTQMGWPITPEVMYWSAKFHYERYGLPLLISENGMANPDFIMLDGKVHDPQRIDYIHRHLLSLERAIDEGIPVLGYQYWSILDNFEWCEGYDKRFGLIYVDYETQRRIPKDSAYDYAKIIRTNGTCL